MDDFLEDDTLSMQKSPILTLKAHPSLTIVTMLMSSRKQKHKFHDEGDQFIMWTDRKMASLSKALQSTLT